MDKNSDLQNGTSVAVALSQDIPAGDVHPVVLSDDELAVWRDDSGTVHVWEDRCPHRGMRLSFGFVRGDRLSCLYHGWQYGSEGACKHIPAHPDMTPPDTLCASVFSSFERFGLVFKGDGAAPEDGSGAWHGVRTIVLQRSQDAVRSALPALNGRSWTDKGPVYLADDGGQQIALAVQPISEHRAAVHVTTSQSDPGYRIALARDLVAYREATNQEGM